MSRKSNQGSEKPPSRAENKDKRTTSNTLGQQTPANDDEWEVELHPSHFATNNNNRPHPQREAAASAVPWHSEVATMTISPATIDATVETDPPIPRQRRRLSTARKTEATPSRPPEEDSNASTQVDAMIQADRIPKRKPKIPIPKKDESKTIATTGNEVESEISTSTNEARADQKQPVRLIIVSAPPKMVDAATDAPKSKPKRAEGAAPEPLTAPSSSAAAAPARTGFDSNPTVITFSESEIEEEFNTEGYESNTMDYDRDEYEPLTTKVTKFYKKRPNRVVPLDSDESFVEWTTLAATANRVTVLRDHPTPTQYADTEIPHSGETSPGRDIITDVFTSSESVSQMQPPSEEPHLTDHGMGGFSLLSGRAFIYMVIPPDGGFGWIILLLSFLAQLIVDGIIFSIGIILPYMSKEFGVSNAQIALVASVQIGCYFTGGAFSSALINSYGFRPVALLGVAVSGVAILIASFSTNFWMMIIFYSLIGGPGMSMIWVSSQLIIGYYFERYRPIASGFSCSGAGAGMVLISIMNTFLALEVGWRNTLRVQVLMLLLIMFMGMAYIEVAPTQVGIVQRPEYNTSSSDEFYGNFYVHNFLRDEEPRKSPTKIESYTPPMDSSRKGHWLMRCFPCCAPKKRSSTSPKPSAPISRASERNFVVRPDPLEKDDLFYTGPVEYEEPHAIEQLDGKELQLVGSEKYIQQVAYGLHNIHNDNDEREHAIAKSRTGSTILHQRNQSKSIIISHRGTTTKIPDKRCHSKIIRSLGRLFAVHLFSSFEFRWLVLAAFLYPIGFNIPFVYSKARAEIPLQYATLIGPAIGVSNFIVRIACGFLAYKVKSWTSYICGGGMVFGGFAVFCSAFFGSDMIWFQMLYGLSYGVAPAVYAALRAIIYVRYLGLSNLTNAFGLTALAMGLGVFIGTSVGGVLVDQTQSYTAVFALAGICIMASGTIKLVLPTVVKYRNRRLERNR